MWRICLLLCMMFFYSSRGQGLPEDLSGYANWLDTSAAFDVTVKVDIYFGQKDTTPTMVLDGSIKKAGKVFYTSLYGNETISEGKKVLWVNNKQRVMVFKDDAGVNKKTRPYMQLMAAIDSSLAGADSIFLSHVQDGKLYTVFSKGLINAMYISFDRQDRLQSCLYYYNMDLMETNNKIRISYMYSDKGTATPIGIGKYVRENNGKVYPTEKYKSYEIKMQ